MFQIIWTKYYFWIIFQTKSINADTHWHVVQIGLKLQKTKKQNEINGLLEEKELFNEYKQK